MKKLLVLLVLVAACAKSPESVPDPRPREIIESANQKVSSYDFKSFEPFLNRENDSVYVINFWATWCAPCIKELPHFKAVAQKYADRRLRVLLVSLDMKREVQGSLLPFVAKHGLGSHVVHLHEPDANAWIPKVSREWSGALPATLIYSKSRRQFYERSFTMSELETEINTFLNQ